MDTPDTWKITWEDRAKHNSSFTQLGPVSGQYLTGDQSKAFFLKSGLPVNVLGIIWNLSDINKDGKLDRKEFSIACFLIKKCLTSLQGAACLPAELPSSLLLDPVQPGSSTIPNILPPSVVPTISSTNTPLFNATFPSQPTPTPPPITNVTASIMSQSSITPMPGSIFTPLVPLNSTVSTNPGA